MTVEMKKWLSLLKFLNEYHNNKIILKLLMWYCLTTSPSRSNTLPAIISWVTPKITLWLIQYVNKKVLLRERKRHTARHAASTPYVVLSLLTPPPPACPDPPPPAGPDPWPPLPPAGWTWTPPPGSWTWPPQAAGPDPPPTSWTWPPPPAGHDPPPPQPAGHDPPPPQQLDLIPPPVDRQIDGQTRVKT